MTLRKKQENQRGGSREQWLLINDRIQNHGRVRAENNYKKH